MAKTSIFGMKNDIKLGPCIQSMDLELYMTQPIPLQAMVDVLRNKVWN